MENVKNMREISKRFVAIALTPELDWLARIRRVLSLASVSLMCRAVKKLVEIGRSNRFLFELDLSARFLPSFSRGVSALTHTKRRVRSYLFNTC